MTPDQPQPKKRSRKLYVLWALALAPLPASIAHQRDRIVPPVKDFHSQKFGVVR